MSQDPNLNPSNDKAVPLDQRNWGPTGPYPKSRLVEPWTPASSVGWGAYHKAMYPARGPVTPWVNFKKMSTGVNIARRLWDQREDLRAAYEAEHGTEPDNWPRRHPGVVIDAVLWVARAACLGCQWIDVRGISMRDAGLAEAPGWREAAAAVARRHEQSNGEFRGDAHAIRTTEVAENASERPPDRNG